MSFLAKHNEVLRSVTWVPIKAIDAFDYSHVETFLVKSLFTEASYLVLITNLRYELKISLDIDRLSEYIQFLSEFLQNRSDISHTFSLQEDDDTLLLESKRCVGPMELIWNFSCELISTTLPKKLSKLSKASNSFNSLLKSSSSSSSSYLSSLSSSSIPSSSIVMPRGGGGSNEIFLDGSTVLYFHFVLPQLLLTTAYNQQIDTLHNNMKSKEEKFNETVRLMALMRPELDKNNNNNNENNLLTFKAENSNQEIEQTIINFNDLENGTPFNVCENPIYSRLLKVASERVIPESNRFSALPTINTLSVSSSAPSISELEKISLSQLSQCPTIKLPSLSASQLSEMFPSQTSQYNFMPNLSSFDSSSSTQTISRFNNDNDNDNYNEMISEEEKERLRIEEEEKAREAQKRQQFKEMVLKHKEQKNTKKRKNVM
ncbi:hypothetical protein Glove_709g57 [Diversispora epigaea]|uniref:Uncharacterized protein n=1 Tax=Diversispora epigaea TaxID=1348612 RepID=A0A397G5G5_9GLOM|nr:hypothetical protein Glove_709g57 [Diversispora epigaea]